MLFSTRKGIDSPFLCPPEPFFHVPQNLNIKLYFFVESKICRFCVFSQVASPAWRGGLMDGRIRPRDKRAAQDRL